MYNHFKQSLSVLARDHTEQSGATLTAGNGIVRTSAPPGGTRAVIGAPTPAPPPPRQTPFAGGSLRMAMPRGINFDLGK